LIPESPHPGTRRLRWAEPAARPARAAVARLYRARLVVGLALAGGIVHAWNMTGSPGAFDDEGTYVAQAWAVQRWGALAHYTYWYDHPPLGWLQIALWSSVTSALPAAGAVLAARPLMAVAQVISCGLLGVLGRSLGMGPLGIVVTVSAFALSPLAVMFHRYVLLDNLATPWLVAAFVLAASPRRSLGAAAGSAACMASAALSKETTLVLLPALLWQLWATADRRSRHFTMAVFGGLFTALMAAYPLLAALKNELIPGEGHVSLFGSIVWQLFGRESSGSVLAAGSDARGLVGLWLGIDAWLLVTGTLLVPLAFLVRRLRPVALGLLVQVLMPLRPGYLPYPYVIAVLPFAALVLGGVLDALWHGRQAGGAAVVRAARWFTSDDWSLLARRGAVLLAVLMFATLALPGWGRRLHDLGTADHTTALRQTVDWLVVRARRDEILVVDDTLWVDLVERGHPPEKVIWFYKVDLDPAVKLADGWRSISYVVLAENVASVDDLPTVQAAVENSLTVASFGTGPDRLSIRKVGMDLARNEGRGAGRARQVRRQV
jgi:hypothetical protein